MQKKRILLTDYTDSNTMNKSMEKKGSHRKIQSIRFPIWMANAIEEVAQKGGHTFTEVVLDLLRQELAVMGYTMGIGREAQEIAKKESHSGRVA